MECGSVVILKPMKVNLFETNKELFPRNFCQQFNCSIRMNVMFFERKANEERIIETDTN